MKKYDEKHDNIAETVVPTSKSAQRNDTRTVPIALSLLMLTAVVVVSGCESRAQSSAYVGGAVSQNEELEIFLRDKYGDDGTRLVLDVSSRFDEAIQVKVATSNRRDGLFQNVDSADVDAFEKTSIEISGLVAGVDTWVLVEVPSKAIQLVASAPPRRSGFDISRTFLLLVGLLVIGSILGFIYAARRGVPMWVRPIPALTAVDEAVGRATEMGKDVLFVPGIQDINDIQTIAGLTILGHVAERTADYRASLEVPTSKSLVMTAAAETVETAYLEAGRHDYFNADSVSYITDEQFGYVAYLSGYMVREKPAACFYLGAFFAESLLLAETGNAVGAVQVAGTAQPSQLPFFVAACDYTLIGEEFFAASAYLSGDADELGSLKGQDVGKVFVAVAVLIGVGLATLAVVTGNADLASAAEYWKNVILAGG